jgi:hypothetical protein
LQDRCLVFGYKCQDRRYQAKNRSFKAAAASNAARTAFDFPELYNEQTFQWDLSGVNRETRERAGRDRHWLPVRATRFHW